jgi:hypothetical protein
MELKGQYFTANCDRINGGDGIVVYCTRICWERTGAERGRERERDKKREVEDKARCDGMGWEGRFSGGLEERLFFRDSQRITVQYEVQSHPPLIRSTQTHRW